MKKILGFFLMAALMTSCGGPAEPGDPGALVNGGEESMSEDTSRTAQALPVCWAPLTELNYQCLDGSGSQIPGPAPNGQCKTQGYYYQYSPCWVFKDARGYLGRHYCGAYVYRCTKVPQPCVKQCQ